MYVLFLFGCWLTFQANTVKQYFLKRKGGDLHVCMFAIAVEHHWA